MLKGDSCVLVTPHVMENCLIIIIIIIIIIIKGFSKIFAPLFKYIFDLSLSLEYFPT
jgi:hypothetical protein